MAGWIVAAAKRCFFQSNVVYYKQRDLRKEMYP